MNRKYVTGLKNDSKASVCLCKIKLANNINFFTILMFPDLKYLKQGFLSVSICVEFEK